MYVQKTALRVQAWQLGAGSAKEAELLQSGKIKRRADGDYELFSREATGESGQLAKPGDYFKVDISGLPYPNDREYFERMHTRLPDGRYLQKPRTLLAWTAEEPPHEAIRFLLRQGLLQIHGDDPARYFSAALWGTLETAARDAVVVIHQVDRNGQDEIVGVTFNFVARDEFNRTYTVISS